MPTTGRRATSLTDRSLKNIRRVRSFFFTLLPLLHPHLHPSHLSCTPYPNKPMAHYRPNHVPGPIHHQGGPPAPERDPAAYVHPSPYAWAPDQGYHHQFGCDSCDAARLHLQRFNPASQEAADAERQHNMFETNIRQLANPTPVQIEDLQRLAQDQQRELERWRARPNPERPPLGREDHYRPRRGSRSTSTDRAHHRREFQDRIRDRFRPILVSPRREPYHPNRGRSRSPLPERQAPPRRRSRHRHRERSNSPPPMLMSPPRH